MDTDNFILYIRASFCSEINYQPENTTDKGTTLMLVHTLFSSLIASVGWEGTEAKPQGSLGFLRENCYLHSLSTSNPIRRQPVPKDLNQFSL